MDLIKMIFALSGGTVLMLTGFAALDVPKDLSAFRWLVGIALLAGGISVWNKWL